MSSNEIELTFIRCPSCKSLMPSTAHKCGMCGLNMDEEGPESSPTENTEKRLRLRQRSTTDIKGDISVSEPEHVETERTEREAPNFYKDLSSEVAGLEEDIEDEEESDFYADDGENDNVSAEEPSTVLPKKRKRRRRRKKRVEEGVNEIGDESSAPVVEEKVDPVQNQKEALPTWKIQAEEPLPVKRDNQDMRMDMKNDNKLVGWFVNYSTEASGKCFEIRLGKKFIGRQELRPHDMLIPDSAISTPHCLLNAEEGRLSLQDLMSEQGTYVKSSGEMDFKRVESTLQLKHGDILKLGSYELIVCLVPRSS